MGINEYVVTKKDRVFEGFLNIDQVTYEFTRTDKLASGPQTRLVMERGDAAGILLYNVDKHTVVLVRQLRIAARRTETPDDAWVLELPAGVIERDATTGNDRFEDPADCARREAWEETGYEVSNCEHIATMLASPGGSSERIHLYSATVRDADRPEKNHGKAEEGEDTEVVEMPCHELFELIRSHGVLDAKLLVAALWLKAKLRSLSRLDAGEQCYAWKEDLDDPKRQRHPRVIGYQSGPLDEMEGIDIWVNAENSDMQMARFFDPGVSASIRYLGAAKKRDGTIFTDTIAEALRRELRGRVSVSPGSVVVTSSGDLRYSHNVKHIIHVACAQHSRSGKTRVDPGDVAEGLRRALLEADRMSRQLSRRLWIQPGLTSMLVPLIGTGNAGADAGTIAKAMMPVALKHFDKHDRSPFRKLFFIAYSNNDRLVLDDLLKQQVAAGKLVPCAEAGVRPRRTPKRSTQSQSAEPAP